MVEVLNVFVALKDVVLLRCVSYLFGLSGSV